MKNFLQSCTSVRTSGFHRFLGTTISACFLAALTGCSGFVTTATDTTLVADAPVMHGKVHGGQQPVSGSHIYLFATGTTGYGGASVSLLKAQTGAVADGSGNFYVTTDAGGNFAFTQNGTCPKAATQTYVLALGGNPGQGGSVNNSAIAAVVATGKCGNINTSTVVNVNELTTVAMVTAAQQYIVDATHIGGVGNLPVGLRVALNLAGDLVNSSTGIANTVNSQGDGAIPTANINGLGNAIAPCLNAAAPTDPACASLFAAVTPSGGTQPTTVLGAMLMMAQNPGYNAPAIYGLASATPPFQPTVSASSPPQDLTLAITYSTPSMTAPGDIVIDANGNAYVGNSPSTTPGATGTDSIAFFPADNSTPALVAANYTSGIHAPNALAIDSGGNIWSTDTGNGTTTTDQVVKISSTGTLAFAFSDANISGPQGIAIDKNDNAWVANANNSTLVKLSSAGADTLQVTSSGFTTPTGVAIDSAGNIFSTGTTSNTILRFNNAGTVSSTAGGYATAGLNQPTGISIDASANLWTINNGSSTITKTNNIGALIAPSGPGPSISNAYVLAIDGAGGAWFANCRVCSTPNNGSPDNLTHVLASQTQSTGSADGYQDSHLSRVGTAAVDGSGNVWVSNNGNGTVTEFLGIATPVLTPISLGVSSSKLGTKP